MGHNGGNDSPYGTRCLNNCSWYFNHGVKPKCKWPNKTHMWKTNESPWRRPERWITPRGKRTTT